MRRFALLVLVVLAGCGPKSPGGNAAVELAVMAEAPAVDAMAAPGQVSGAGATGPVDAALPQIAYAYRLGFRLPADKVAPAQAAHMKLCDVMGPARCRLVAQERRGGDMAGGSMAFEVDAREARGFADGMDAAVGEAGGSTTTRAVSAEDVSKAIIDTEARLRAKQALADRLLELIRKRDGKVGELVEAERAFAEAQEQLDAARSGLETMRRRVAMSRIDAEYASIGSDGGGGWAVRDAIDAAGRTLGMSVAALIRVLVAALPWVVLGGVLVWGIRRWRRRG